MLREKGRINQGYMNYTHTFLRFLELTRADVSLEHDKDEYFNASTLSTRHAAKFRHSPYRDTDQLITVFVAFICCGNLQKPYCNKSNQYLFLPHLLAFVMCAHRAGPECDALDQEEVLVDE